MPAAPLASSASGISRSSAQGENAASMISTAPAITALTLRSPAPELIAAPPSDSTATIANFDRISATSNSTARIAQIRRAGHTIAANASGSISTITYTAASRISNSIHSANAAPIMNSPTRKARNGEPAAAVERADHSAGLGEEVCARVAGGRGDESAQLIGGGQQQHRQRRGDRDAEHRQRQVAERRSRQQREV